MFRFFAVLFLMVTGLPVTALAGPWVLTTDYSSFGGISGFEEAAPWTVSPDLATVPGDAGARWHEGNIYVVGRGGANLIQVYDPTGGFSLEREFSLGSNLNPQDIAFDTAGEAYEGAQAYGRNGSSGDGSEHESGDQIAGQSVSRGSYIQGRSKLQSGKIR